MLNARILLTGSRGLSAYLAEKLREIKNVDLIQIRKFDYSHLPKSVNLIIHAGWSRDEGEYIRNIVKTTSLLNIYTQKFIFLSTVDVYSPNLTKYAEYKNLGEELVYSRQDVNPILLRCSSLLGPKVNNTITKILKNEDLTLTSDSILNAILYSDVLDFILNIERYPVIANLASTHSSSVEELKKEFNSTSLFGKHAYFALARQFSEVNRTTLETVKLYKERYL